MTDADLVELWTHAGPDNLDAWKQMHRRLETHHTLHQLWNGQCPADLAKSAASGFPTGLPLHMPAREDFQTRLIAVLLEQVAAINRLAQSNEALVRAMAEDQGQDEGEATSYLNGRPRT